jgi:hypothetical protein
MENDRVRFTFRNRAHPIPVISNTLGRISYVVRTTADSGAPYVHIVPIIPSPSRAYRRVIRASDPKEVVFWMSLRVVGMVGPMREEALGSVTLLRAVWRD